MPINFKLEYCPKQEEIKIIHSDSDFNWIPAAYIDPFHNPTFKLGEKFGTWIIKISRDWKQLRIFGEFQNNKYISYEKINYQKTTFTFSNFKQIKRNDDGKWVKVKELQLNRINKRKWQSIKKD